MQTGEKYRSASQKRVPTSSSYRVRRSPKVSLTRGYTLLDCPVGSLSNLSVSPCPTLFAPTPSSVPQLGDNSTKIPATLCHPLRGPSFPEAARLSPANTDLSPPSINSLGKHVTRGRLRPDTARKLPKVQRACRGIPAGARSAPGLPFSALNFPPSLRARR